jgi:hypothetical protein
MPQEKKWLMRVVGYTCLGAGAIPLIIGGMLSQGIIGPGPSVMTTYAEREFQARLIMEGGFLMMVGAILRYAGDSQRRSD